MCYSVLAYCGQGVLMLALNDPSPGGLELCPDQPSPWALELIPTLPWPRPSSWTPVTSGRYPGTEGVAAIVLLPPLRTLLGLEPLNMEVLSSRPRLELFPLTDAAAPPPQTNPSDLTDLFWAFGS